MPSTYEARTGPQTITGPVRLGQSLDGARVVNIDVTQNVLITGPSKSGATTALQVLTARIAECTNTSIWAFDSEGDLRSFVWPVDETARIDVIDWYSDVPADLSRMLDSADQLVQVRQREGIEFPVAASALVLVLNLRGIQANDVFGERIRAQIDRLANTGPAAGIFIVRAERAPIEMLHTGFGAKIAMRPDRQLLISVFGGASPENDAVRAILRDDPRPGTGVARIGAGMPCEAVSVDLIRAAVYPVHRAEPVQLDPASRNVLTRYGVGYNRRWERLELVSSGKVSPPGDMPVRDSDFLRELVADSGTGGQSSIALVEALADRRGIPEKPLREQAAERLPGDGFSAFPPELVDEVDVWLAAQVEQGRLVQHPTFYQGEFYVLAEHADVIAGEDRTDDKVLLTISAPHDRPIGLLELGQMLITFASTARIGQELTTLHLDVTQDFRGGAEFTVYANPATGQ